MTFKIEEVSIKTQFMFTRGIFLLSSLQFKFNADYQNEPVVCVGMPLDMCDHV